MAHRGQPPPTQKKRGQLDHSNYHHHQHQRYQQINQCCHQCQFCGQSWIPDHNRVDSSERKGKGVAFVQEVSKSDFDSEEVDQQLLEMNHRSKLKVLLRLLLLLFFLSLCAFVLGAIAAALEPWWSFQSTTATPYESIQVGLWRTCYRTNGLEEWSKCTEYSDGDSSKSPFEHMTLLQGCVVAGVVSLFFALLFIAIAINFRLSNYLRLYIFLVLIFTLGATIMFGLTIAYVLEGKTAVDLVNANVLKQISTPSEVTKGAMFGIGCGATGLSGLAFIVSCVLFFIHEPLALAESGNESVGPSRNGMLGTQPAVVNGKGEGVVNPIYTSNSMLARNHYEYIEEQIADSTGIGARPPRLKLVGGPPSYFKRTEGYGAGGLLNPNPVRKKKRYSNTYDISGDFSPYFD